MKAENLKCDLSIKPIQVDSANPEFSWTMPCGHNGAAQTAYRIIVDKDIRFSGVLETVWDTGKINSSENAHVFYAGLPLEPFTGYVWKVKLWDENSDESEWSERAAFETGLMRQWEAKWIGYDKNVGEPYNPKTPFYCADDFEAGENAYYLPPVPYMRKEFALDGDIRKATIFVSALGLAEVWVNGSKVGNDYFVPGLSDYSKTVYSRAYDVTGSLKKGKNAIGTILADGWYAGYIGLNSREWYGDQPRAMVQLNVILDDGKCVAISTDDSWTAAYGPLLESDILQGETYDARKELSGWSEAGCCENGWEPVEVGSQDAIIPTAHIGVPIVEHGRIAAKSIITKSDDRIIVDFGECFTGVTALTVRGARGSRVTVRHAEILDEHGELHLRGNRSARCQDSYILKGDGQEYFQPRFTYHGFRFAEITGVDAVELISAEGVMVSSAMPDLTEFTCSSDMINTVFKMIRNTQRSNQFDTPIDCCARDERLGWGMEGNHFSHAMSYMNNQEAFTRKWCKDIWDGQRESGVLEAIAPPMLMKDIEQFVGDLQSNHGLYMIYTLYKMYGETQVVEQNYGKLQKYFAFMENNSDRHVRIATSGDWLGILEETGHSDMLHGYGDCSPAMLGTCHYAVSARMMEILSRGIGRQKEAEKYAQLYKNIRKAFRQHFIQRDGTLRGGRQGDYLMALACDFFPEKIRDKAARHLFDDLTEKGKMMWRGGTVTTPFFLGTLEKLGRNDLANRFLVSDEYPSIGFMHKMGATTVWERWDGIFEDGRIHPQVMNAMNHIGLTPIASYIIGGLGGIEALEAGFRKISICPGVSEEVKNARTAFQSIYGEILVDWSWERDRIRLLCKIPATAAAQIILPCDPDGDLVMVSGVAQDIIKEEGRVKVEVQSGTYEMVAGLRSVSYGANTLHRIWPL